MSITSPSPSPSPSPKRNISPSEEAEKAASTVPQNTDTTGKKGLTGVPVGTKVLKAQYTVPGPKGRLTRTRDVYASTQYAAGSGATAFASLNNQEKIDLLAQLAQIPGLYARKKAPTSEYLQSMGAGKIVPIREEDAKALEDVMRYADTVGDSYTDAIKNLLANPEAARGFFDMGGTRAGAQRKISLTPSEALTLELQQSFADYLDINADKKEAAAYAKKINDLEKKRGGALTSLERQQLLFDAIQTKAAEVFKDGIDEADTLLMRKGALGGTYNVLRETYRDYGIPIDEKTLYKQAIGSVRSKQALDNTINKIKLQAEVAMPAIKTYIQQGLSPREALGSYVSLYSKFMGVPETQVDLTKLAPVFSGDKVMPYNDWEKFLYTLPEAKNSPLVKEQKMNDYRTLIRNFIG